MCLPRSVSIHLGQPDRPGRRRRGALGRSRPRDDERSAEVAVRGAPNAFSYCQFAEPQSGAVGSAVGERRYRHGVRERPVEALEVVARELVPQEQGERRIRRHRRHRCL